MSPLDLHVLSTPPAFVLSQDQTLMFNPFPHPLFPVSDSPKPSTFPSKSGVYSLRNLTVLYTLDLLRCIVFKDRFAFVLSLNARFIIAKHPLIVKPFFQISDIFFQPHHIVEKPIMAHEMLYLSQKFPVDRAQPFLLRNRFFVRKTRLGTAKIHAIASEKA